MLLALLLLVCWPIAEVYVAITVADAIGVLWTILLLIASWPIGIWVTRLQSRTAWLRLSDAIAAGRPPAKEVLDGALGLLGGGLLIVPGFITDVFGICLLLTPIRALTRRGVVRLIQTRLMVRAVRFTRGPEAPSDVDSTASDIDPPSIRR